MAWVNLIEYHFIFLLIWLDEASIPNFLRFTLLEASSPTQIAFTSNFYFRFLLVGIAQTRVPNSVKIKLRLDRINYSGGVGRLVAS